MLWAPSGDAPRAAPASGVTQGVLRLVLALLTVLVCAGVSGAGRSAVGTVMGATAVVAGKSTSGAWWQPRSAAPEPSHEWRDEALKPVVGLEAVESVELDEEDTPCASAGRAWFDAHHEPSAREGRGAPPPESPSYASRLAVRVRAPRGPPLT